jgi:hypothetical protein
MDTTDVQFTDSSGAFYFTSTSSWRLYYYPSSTYGAVHEFLLKFNHPDYNTNVYNWRAPFASWQKSPPVKLPNIELVRNTAKKD